MNQVLLLHFEDGKTVLPKIMPLPEDATKTSAEIWLKPIPSLPQHLQARASAQRQPTHSWRPRAPVVQQSPLQTLPLSPLLCPAVSRSDSLTICKTHRAARCGAHVFNPRIWEAQAGASLLSSGPTRATQWNQNKKYVLPTSAAKFHLYSWNNDSIRWFNHVFKEILKLFFFIFSSNT